MKLNIQSELSYQIDTDSTLLFAIRCPETTHQHIVAENISPSREVEWKELPIGLENNAFISMHVPDPGEFTLNYQVDVESNYSLDPVDNLTLAPVHSLDGSVIPYLFPSRYASGDKLRNAAFDTFGHCQSPLETVVAIENWLHENLSYQVGSSTEHSSAVDTYVSRVGVCRDFAHLGIAFCRAMNIPARYVSAYSPDLDPLDFHAVFEVHAGGHWYLFDATRQVALNRIARIATGRDAGDVSTASIYGRVTSFGMNVSIQEGEASFNEPRISRSDLEANGNAIRIV